MTFLSRMTALFIIMALKAATSSSFLYRTLRYGLSVDMILQK
jgi:hypothetical protein